jgi:hypothetical protein
LGLIGAHLAFWPFSSCTLQKRIVQQPSSSSSSSTTSMTKELQNMAHQLVAVTREMLQIEEQFLIPVVAHYIPASEQMAFNQKVIRKLGIWDSRLHLVGMQQAIMNLDRNNHRHNYNHRNKSQTQQELQLFEATIPYLPRSLIPRWKRTLYDPKMTALEGY